MDILYAFLPSRSFFVSVHVFVPYLFQTLKLNCVRMYNIIQVVQISCVLSSKHLPFPQEEDMKREWVPMDWLLLLLAMMVVLVQFSDQLFQEILHNSLVHLNFPTVTCSFRAVPFSHFDLCP